MIDPIIWKTVDRRSLNIQFLANFSKIVKAFEIKKTDRMIERYRDYLDWAADPQCTLLDQSDLIENPASLLSAFFIITNCSSYQLIM
jgi:biotin-(acetyl-CoA carboxylase) ligase